MYNNLSEGAQILIAFITYIVCMVGLTVATVKWIEPIIEETREIIDTSQVTDRILEEAP